MLKPCTLSALSICCHVATHTIAVFPAWKVYVAHHQSLSIQCHYQIHTNLITPSPHTFFLISSYIRLDSVVGSFSGGTLVVTVRNQIYICKRHTVMQYLISKITSCLTAPFIANCQDDSHKVTILDSANLGRCTICSH